MKNIQSLNEYKRDDNSDIDGYQRLAKQRSTREAELKNVKPRDFDEKHLHELMLAVKAFSLGVEADGSIKHSLPNKYKEITDASKKYLEALESFSTAF